MIATYHHRFMALLAIVVLAFAAMAQGRPDIVRSINQQGQVTVQAPDELAKRSNNELNKAQDRKQNAKIDEEDATNLDEDKREDNRPRRTHTSQQTIQGRSVGYRIQAFSDNNMSTAKAAAQARARAIAMKFPQYRSYISYHAPSWRLRLGDFREQSDAQKALQRLRAAFPSYGREMIIVRDHINVWSGGN
ncbi:MAG: SPOR domain-containing protein [Muribaculaceae bacterium]|nr:SPOR domain-containing protein [Muribaculaceae bacterium]